MPNLVELVAELARIFDDLRLRFAVGGALATNYWGVVRTTQDIDFLIAIPAVTYESLALALQSIGCRLRSPNGEALDVTAIRLRQYAIDRKLIECYRDSVRIELFVPCVPLQDEILRRAVKLPLGGREVPVTTAEDMILLKMAFHRAKDLQDVRGMLWVQRGRLDLEYLRLWSTKTHQVEVQHELELLIAESLAEPNRDSTQT